MNKAWDYTYGGPPGPACGLGGWADLTCGNQT